jgi:hypothetical protein
MVRCRIQRLPNRTHSPPHVAGRLRLPRSRPGPDAECLRLAEKVKNHRAKAALLTMTDARLFFAELAVVTSMHGRNVGLVGKQIDGPSIQIGQILPIFQLWHWLEAI